ncbi:Gfo/Idh/MocA family oxidoreductase [Alkalihalobacillus hwajinpoensis]|uniref:Gfo/Idh/MocA family protein n=1 Tax=Guptibacillus hwajinpoensis TaxID=208199 RepID=UPI0018832825|nr:Gfo/Idh/MocA family oxidoreductase [Pseudalkalibacillus hwajinpoensis]MBF0705729.1 Gfo/Idh/MocA family oxidoreductase [Pseudalkalibacillus hwajinpoensis]
MKKIRWGIIGCGNVTEKKSGPGFQKAENSELVAVMRRDATLAEDYAKRHNVPKWYTNAEALIDDEEVDAIYIATPPSTHKEYAILAARASKPVYVEKPMALNTEECEEMIKACDENHVPLFVAFYRRAMPALLQVKEVIESGALGNIRFVTTVHHKKASEQEKNGNLPWRVQPEISGGGHFFDLASHTLDFLDYVLGPIESVNGFATNQAELYQAEDIVSGSYVFESGVHGTGQWCFNSYKNEDWNEIVGDKGSLLYSTLQERPMILKDEQGEREIEVDYPEHVQQPLIQTIVNELNGESHSPSTGKTALRTSKVMDQLVANYYQKSGSL